MRDIKNKFKKLLPGSWFTESRGLKTILERFAGKDGNGAPTSNGEIKDIKNFPPNAKQAAQHIFSTVTGTHELHSFQQINERVGFQSDSTRWDSNGVSRQEIHHKARVQTCSGPIVPIEEITGKCSQCSGYDAVLLRCHVCGTLLCRLHAHQHTLQDRTASVWLCEVHYMEVLKTFDLWRNYDER